MQSKDARKEAVRKFKERKPLLGAYAIRCTATSQVWVGASRNLDATRNSSWFCLRNGKHIDKPLQEEWKTHGETAFQYEILEKLDEDLHPLEVANLLKEKRGRWIAQLSARPLN